MRRNAWLERKEKEKPVFHEDIWGTVEAKVQEKMVELGIETIQTVNGCYHDDQWIPDANGRVIPVDKNGGFEYYGLNKHMLNFGVDKVVEEMMKIRRDRSVFYHHNNLADLIPFSQFESVLRVEGRWGVKVDVK